MSKQKAPLGSAMATGAIGKKVVFYRRRGVDVARKYVPYPVLPPLPLEEIIVPACAWEHIETIHVTVPVASVEFTGISADWRYFRLIIAAARSLAITGGMGMRFNGDAGTNYNFRDLAADAGGVSTTLFSGQNYGVVGHITATVPSMNFAYIQNHEAAVQKSWIAHGGALEYAFRHISGRWLVVSAKIHSIWLSPLLGNFVTGSCFILEGSKE